MDGAVADARSLAFLNVMSLDNVGGFESVSEVKCVNSLGSVFSADLGGSSSYSDEDAEDQSGEGFHVNISWTWVNRF